MFGTWQQLIVWASIAVLLGHLGCAARGIGMRPGATEIGAPLGTLGLVSTEPRLPQRPRRGWAAGTRDCVKDFLRGQSFDPTVIAMLPLVFPVCTAVALFGVQPEPPSIDATASVRARETGRTLPADPKIPVPMRERVTQLARDQADHRVVLLEEYPERADDTEGRYQSVGAQGIDTSLELPWAP